MNLQNKTALITGGATGLGLQIAGQLLKKDMKVVICSRNQSHLQEAKDKLNSDKLATQICDITDFSQVEAMIKAVGSIDVVVNAAGIWLQGNLDEYPPEKIKQVIDVNLTGTIFVTRAVLPTMKQQKSGYIVNISSTAGTKPYPQETVYVASKYGVRGFTDVLKSEVKSEGIKVVGFYPGGMKTQLHVKAGFPQDDYDNFMDPSKIAEVIVFILERDQSMVMDHVAVNRGKK